MSNHWLLDEASLQQLRDARRLHMRPSPTQIQAFEREQLEARDAPLPRGMTVAGNVAELRVVGILTKAPDIFAMFFGGGNTTYRDLIAGLAVARSDPSIKQISLFVDSPGGDVDGLFELLAALEQTRSVKAISVRAANAMSAAYGISAVAGRIDATNAGSRFGSVGVAASYFVDEDIVDITNTDSPDKRPDVTTPEGKATVQRELDAIHELFIEQIARGRASATGAPMPVATVREEFGRGGTMVAGEARKRGMIDAVAGARLRSVGNAAASEETSPQADGPRAPSLATKETRSMTLEELRAQYPHLISAAVAEGVAQGTAQGAQTERSRVTAHLTYGRRGGAAGLQVAFAEIAKGTSTNDEAVQAQYMTLALDERDRSLRAGDEQQIAGAANGAGANGATQPGRQGTGDAPPVTEGTAPAQQQHAQPPATPEAKRAQQLESLGSTVADNIMAMQGGKRPAPAAN